MAASSKKKAPAAKPVARRFCRRLQGPQKRRPGRRRHHRLTRLGYVLHPEGQLPHSDGLARQSRAHLKTTPRPPVNAPQTAGTTPTTPKAVTPASGAPTPAKAPKTRARKAPTAKATTTRKTRGAA